MKRILLNAGYWMFHLVVGAYAVVLLSSSVSVRAQTAASYQIQIGELERRVGSIETLNLDHRMTILETILMDLQTGNILNRFTMGGTGLLIAERVVSALRRKQESE